VTIEEQQGKKQVEPEKKEKSERYAAFASDQKDTSRRKRIGRYVYAPL
jgi:hypothetical protein